MQYDFIVKIVMNTFGLKKFKLFESFKNDTNVLIVLSIFPNDNFLSGNFPRVMLGPMWSRSLQLGRALRLEQARGPQALRLGIDRLGKFTLGKMHSWEVVSWKKNTLGKLPFGKNTLLKKPP